MQPATSLPAMLFSRESDEWETPWPLFEWLNSSFQFTLDPCATAATAKCRRFFTREDNGLNQSWANERVFMNPPYSNVGKWIEKARREAENGATVVCLTASRTDTRWFQEQVIGKASEIQFLPGRVTFLRPQKSANTAPFPSVVIVFRPPVQRRFLRLNPNTTGKSSSKNGERARSGASSETQTEDVGSAHIPVVRDSGRM